MIHFLDFSNPKMVAKAADIGIPTSCSASSRTPCRSTARRRHGQV
jgi:hypothetical protein